MASLHTAAGSMAENESWFTADCTVEAGRKEGNYDAGLAVKVRGPAAPAECESDPTRPFKKTPVKVKLDQRNTFRAD